MTIVVNFCELKIYYMNQLYIQLNIRSTKFQSYKKNNKNGYLLIPQMYSSHLSNKFFKCTVILDLKKYKKRHLYSSRRPLCDHIGYTWRHCQRTPSFHRSVGLKSSKKLPHRGSWTICYIVLLRAFNRWLKKIF